MKKSNWLLSTIILAIVLAMLFFAISCQSGNSTSKEAIDQIRKAVDAAWLSEDADVIIAHTADDMILMPPNVGKKTGKEEIRNFLQGFFDQFTITEQKITEREVIVSGDWAFERGSYEMVVVPEGGSEGISDQINFIGIWQRQSDGAWREVRAIWNSTKPIAGAQ